MARQMQERRQKKLYGDPLFRVLYMPLWYQSKGDLSPVEAWQEALMVIDEIKATDIGIRHLEVARIVDKLLLRYSTFDDKKREAELAAHSMMMVMATVMFMLGEASHNWKENPHRRLCLNISGVLSRIGGFKELCNDVRESERRTVDDEGPLPIRDFIGDKTIDLGQLPTFTDDEIRRAGLNTGHPLAVLQAMHIMKTRMTADNDWIAIYIVLLERRIIARTMTAFCAMVNDVFSLSINSRYLSATLRDHGENFDKWSEAYDDQRRHIELARQFRSVLDKLAKGVL